MCKITDEIIRRAKHILKNSSLDIIERNYQERLVSAKKTSDPIAKDLAIKMAKMIKEESRKSYFLAQEIIKEYAKANNSKAKRKKEKERTFSQAQTAQVL
ncbi:MAG: hypothetical protein PHP37_02705 [Patescibacteria group bacterium]|nr:hypothetical protein [Patescibacteria group bacterium]